MSPEATRRTNMAFQKGDRINHRVYGDGIVEGVVTGGGIARVYFESIAQTKPMLVGELSLAAPSRAGASPVATAPPTTARPAPVIDAGGGSGSERLTLECLRQGLPPVGKLEAWTVGLDDVRTKLGAAIEDASQRRRGSILVVEGDYGQGKSHVGRWAREIALKRNLAVMEIELDGQALSLTNPGQLLARLLASLELPDGKGGAQPSGGLGVLLQVAGARLRGVVPKELSEFSFFLKRWEDWHADEEAVELLEQFLSGELSAAKAQREFRSCFRDPGLVVPALRMSFGRQDERVRARTAQMERLLHLAELCGSRGTLVVIDELDHDRGGRFWDVARVRTGLSMFEQVAASTPLVTMLLATPGIPELKGARFRDVRLPALAQQDLKLLVQRTVDLYRRVHPQWTPGDGFDRFFSNLWVLYRSRFEKLGWGPRFFVRATVEACELSAAQGAAMSDLNL